jgi:SAM-dependent methyltransferase
MLNASILNPFFEEIERRKLYSSRENLQFYLDYLFKGIRFQDTRMLDIGGGMGVFSFYAACMGAREVVCLEPESEGSSSGMASTFTQLRDALKLRDRVRLLPSPLLDFSDRDGFDIILLHNSINHLDEPACITLQKNPEARKSYSFIFQHLSSLSKPGGRLVIADCSRYNLFPLLGLKNPFVPQIEWHKHQPPKRWAELLRGAGFNDAKVDWTSFNHLRGVGRALLGNALGAFFCQSHFRLMMQKS